MHPTLKAALDLAAIGLTVRLLKPTLRPLNSSWLLSGHAPKDLQAAFKEGQQVGVQVSCRLGSNDPFDTSDRLMPYLGAIEVEIVRPEHEPDALVALASRLPDWQRYPRVNAGDGSKGFTLFLTTVDALRNRPLAVSSDTVVTPLGKRRPSWTVSIGGPIVVVPPSRQPMTGGSYAWGALSLPDALNQGTSLLVDGEALAVLVREERVGKAVVADATDADDLSTMLGELSPVEWLKVHAKWMSVGRAVFREFAGGEEESQAFTAWKKWTGAVHQDQNLSDTWTSFSKMGEHELTLEDLYRVVGRVRPKVLRAAAFETATFELAVRALGELELSDVQFSDAVGLLMQRSERDKTGLKRTAIAQALKAARKAGKKKQRADNPMTAGGLELALINEVIEELWTHPDGTRTLFSCEKNNFEWSNGVWMAVGQEQIEAKVHRHLKRIALEDMKNTKRSIEHIRALRRMMDEAGSLDRIAGFKKAVAAGVLSDLHIDKQDNPLGLVSPSKYLKPTMNLANGFLEWKKDGTFTIVPHHPSHEKFSKLPVSYQPEATCPVWLSTLNDIFGFLEPNDRQEVIAHWQELFGYILQDSRELASFIYCVGPGGDGKTTMQKVISDLLGEAVDASGIDNVVGKQFAESNFVGKKLFLEDDANMDNPFPHAFVKKFSEEKIITGEVKFGNKFNFTSSILVWLNCNGLMQTRDTGNSILRRAHVFRFQVLAMKEDKGRNRELVKELPGILNWAMEGFARVLKNGDFTKSKFSRVEYAKWIEKTDTIASFLLDNYHVSGRSIDEVTTMSTWDTFQEWANKTQNGTSMGRNTFLAKFEKLPGVSRHGSQFRGLKRKSISNVNSQQSLHDLYSLKDLDSLLEQPKEEVKPVKVTPRLGYDPNMADPFDHLA